MLRRLLLLLPPGLLLLAAPWATPFARGGEPVGRWPLGGRVTLLRGFEPPPQRWSPGHRGIDLAATVGQPVLATASGRVTLARSVAGRGVVVVQHGELRSTYEPVDAVVRPGQDVAPGDVVGRVAQGTHCPVRTCLHWGLRRGETYLDPRTPLLNSAPGLRLLPDAAAGVVGRRSAERAAWERALTGDLARAGREPGRHGFLRPVPGAVSSPFGPRFHPIRHVRTLHDGTDFAAGCGTPIVAAYAGVVRRHGWHPSYGWRLIVDHGPVDGRRVSTGYNHAVRFVARAGQRVRRGQVVGYVGSTGLSTGCHLHLMLWLDGRLTDPLDWL